LRLVQNLKGDRLKKKPVLQIIEAIKNDANVEALHHAAKQRTQTRIRICIVQPLSEFQSIELNAIVNVAHSLHAPTAADWPTHLISIASRCQDLLANASD
jgi:hypothetical protein